MNDEEAKALGWTNAATMKVWEEVFSNFSIHGWDRFCVGFCSRPNELAPDLQTWAETYLQNLPLSDVAWEELAQNMIDTYHHG